MVDDIQTETPPAEVTPPVTTEPNPIVVPRPPVDYSIPKIDIPALTTQTQKPISSDDFFKNLAGNAPQILANSQDKFAYNKPYSYNPESENQSQNFDRFYAHTSFRELGYKPWADNEKLYREQGSKFGDIARAIFAGTKLAQTGFMSPIRSWGDILSGNPLALDYVSSKEMAQLNVIGSSSKGGVTGFASNLLVNSGYTVGLIGEMFLEDAILTAAAPETGFTSLGLAAVRSASTLTKLGKYITSVEGLGKAMQAMKNYDVASGAYKAFKATGKFINPLEHTFAAASVINKSESLTNLAKVSNTAGAFYRDMRAANLVLSEAKMEGASAADELRKTLTDDYYAKHKEQPSFEELIKINQTAVEAGDHTLYANIPAIYLTNKVVFDNLFKRFKSLDDYVSKYKTKIDFIKGKGYEVIKSDFKTAVKGLLKPKLYGKVTANYFKGNFMEGMQESVQEVVSGAYKDYYTNLYNNPSKHGLDYSLSEAVGENIKKQFSGQGFETFASGFLMGGLIGTLGRGITGGKELALKLRSPERYKAYEAKKNEYAAEQVKKLNEIYKDPLKYFGSGILNYSNATSSAQGQMIAETSGDNKTWQDWHDQSVWSHVTSAIESGTFDNFMGQLDEIKGMSKEGIKEAYGIDGTEVLKNIAKIKKRAEDLKAAHEYWDEKAPNPFDPSKHKKDTPEYNTEALGYLAWNNAKNHAIWYNHSFARNQQRIESLNREVLAHSPIQEASANDFKVLMDMNALKKETSVLKQEISLLRGAATPENKKELKYKEEKLDLLKTYQEALQGHYVNQIIEKKINETGQEAPTKNMHDELKDAYVAYINHLAKGVKGVFVLRDKVDASFEKIKDIHRLGMDNINLASAVNMLADPEGFHEYHDRLNKTLTDMYAARGEQIEKSVKETQSRIETNVLLNTLYKRGYVVDAADLAKLADEAVIPEQFYDIANKQVVKKGDARYAEFEEIVKDYLSAKQGKPLEPPVTDVPPVTTQTATGKIRIVRHGKDKNDEDELTSGETSTPLVESGKQDVRKGLEQVKKEDVPAIITSPITRAKETADIIGKEKGVKVEENDALAPWHIGDNKTGFSEVSDEDWAKMADWFALHPDEKAYAGEDEALKEKYKGRQPTESFNQFKTRVISALPELTNKLPDGGVLVTHSNVTQLIKAYIANGSKDDANLGLQFIKEKPSDNGEFIDFERQQVNPFFVKKETPSTTEVTKQKLQEVSYDVKKKLAAVKNGRELDVLEKELEALLTNYPEVKRLGLDSDILTVLVEAKRKELGTTFDWDSLQEGNVVMMHDPRYNLMVVKKKTNNDVKLYKFGESGNVTLTIKKNDVAKNIKYMYNEGVEGMEPEGLTKEERDLAQTNQKEAQEFTSDAAELKRLQEEALKQGVVKTDDEFFKDLGCK